ncbi:DUF4194 domain-containing protein [Treponema sp. OMZ 787]|nr:DUF4194 domain-containing protein [Treponema sp. OMZ 787]
MTTVWAAPCIKLLQGTLYENEGDSDSWRLLIQYQGEIASFFDQIGISVFIEPAEGYAFLEQKEDEEGAPESVRLIRRYPLSFEMSPSVFYCVKHWNNSTFRKTILLFWFYLKAKSAVCSRFILKKKPIKQNSITNLPNI